MKGSRSGLLILAGLLAVMWACAVPGSASASGCVVYVSPAPSSPSAPTPAPTSGGCYATFDSALAAAAANAPTNNTVLIGADYAGQNYAGDFRAYEGTAGPCQHGSVSYADDYIGDNWNDRVSSAYGQHSCDAFTHFHDILFFGNSKTCGLFPGCATLGNMNNETSSETWHEL